VTLHPDRKPVRNSPMESCQALHPEDVTVTVNGGGPVPGERGQVRYAPGLEERVAALEAALAETRASSAEVQFTFPEWTPEQAEEFRAEFGRRAVGGGFDTRHVRWLPPAPVLTPEAARALLSECVTVVKPGETLVIRVPDSWTPEQAGAYQQVANEAREDGRISFPVVIVPGEQLAVARPEPDSSPGNLATETG
jgi:hypothetical protein